MIEKGEMAKETYKFRNANTQLTLSYQSEMEEEEEMKMTK